MLRVASRIALIVLAYAAACSLAGFLFVVGYAPAMQLSLGRPVDLPSLMALSGAGAILAVRLMVSMLPPAVLAIALTEATRTRDAAVFAGFGALCGLWPLLAGWVPWGWTDGARSTLTDSIQIVAFMGIGALSALLYWWIAGRSAGRWRPDDASTRGA